MKIIFCNIIEEFGEYSYSSHFSDVISRYTNIPKKGIAIVSFDGESIGCIAIYKNTGKIATQKDRITFRHAVIIQKNINLIHIKNKLPARIKSHFIRQTKSHMTLFSDKVCNEVLNYFLLEHPDIYENIILLNKRIENSISKYEKNAKTIIAQEKDAVNLVFKMFNFNESDIPIWDSDDNTAPFLKGYNNAVIREDPMINHDSQVFGDWSKFGQYAQGIVEFVKENQRITLMNVNRQPLEKTLGVDLLIYHHTYRSYIFIQYKRMTKENDLYVYRPIDSSYKSEIERMNSFMKEISKNLKNKNLKNYRLNDEFFYFKLCPARIENYNSNRMIKGMYLPLELWNILLNDDCISGPKGGKQINYNNVGRYFNNTQFINLAQNGWIGSKIENSEKLTEMIKYSIESDNSLTLAEYTINKKELT